MSQTAPTASDVQPPTTLAYWRMWTCGAYCRCGTELTRVEQLSVRSYYSSLTFTEVAIIADFHLVGFLLADYIYQTRQ